MTATATLPYRRIEGPAEWTAAMAALAATAPAPASPDGLRYSRVVIPLLVGASDLFAVREGLIGHALRLRGADVTFVVCDGLAACDARTYDNDHPDQCHGCRRRGWENLTAFGHRVVDATSFVDRATATRLWRAALTCPDREVFDLHHLGCHVGAHAYASTLRYFRAGGPEWDRPAFVAKARQYLGAAMIMAEAASRGLRALGADRVFSSHGVYVSWGPWADMAMAAGIDYVRYSSAYRRNTLVFGTGTDHTLRLGDLWERWRDRDVPPEDAAELDAYLTSRESASSDIHRFFDEVDRDVAALDRRIGVPQRAWRSRACLFSNLAWDAAQPESGGVFGDMFTWIRSVVEWYAARPDDLLYVKAHPAESTYVEETPDHWRLAHVLAEAFPSLPPNVRVIPPDDNVSNFALYGAIDLGLVNTSTVGFEMVLRGLPVLVTGARADYEEEELVLIPRDRNDHLAILGRLCDGTERFRPDPALARRFAYAFFFRKAVPFEPLDVETWSPVGLRIDSLADLAPGRHPGLDVIVDGILQGAPFEAPPST